MTSETSFDYCPSCGCDAFVANNPKSQRCLHCGFVYYHNPSVAVALFVRDVEGRLLVATRAKEPAKGTLDLPGGFVDAGETGEGAALRELSEETGLEVTLEQISYTFSLPNRYLYSNWLVPTLDLFYTIQLDERMPTVYAMDDVAQLRWLPLDALDPNSFGLDSIRQGVRCLLSSSQCNLLR